MKLTCFGVLTVSLVNIKVFWDINAISSCRLGLLDPECGGSTLLRNVGDCLLVDTAKYPRGL